MEQQHITSFFHRKKANNISAVDTCALLKDKLAELDCTKDMENSVSRECTNCKVYKAETQNAENRLKHARAALKKSTSILFEKDKKIKDLQDKLAKFENTEKSKKKQVYSITSIIISRQKR